MKPIVQPPLFCAFVASACFLACSFVLVACGQDTNDSESAPPKQAPTAETILTPVPTVQVPTDITHPGLVAFLKQGGWKAWTPESGVRNSVRAHGTKVQTFHNAALVKSLRAGNAVHPKGSAAVKVLYAADGKTLSGYAIEVKQTEGSTGNDWVWYEGFEPGYSDALYGVGNPTCTGCHSNGVDFVLAKAP